MSSKDNFQILKKDILSIVNMAIFNNKRNAKQTAREYKSLIEGQKNTPVLKEKKSTIFSKLFLYFSPKKTEDIQFSNEYKIKGLKSNLISLKENIKILENLYINFEKMEYPDKFIDKKTQERIIIIKNKVKFLYVSIGVDNNRDLKSLQEISLMMFNTLDQWGKSPEINNGISKKIVSSNKKGIRTDSRQSSLDLGDTYSNHQREPRIYLPVSTSRRWELMQMGANEDINGLRRSNNLWIPLSEKEKFHDFLPLAYKKEKPKLKYPPIRSNAVGQNLWSIFDKETWKHIRTTAYDRAGHRCQLCGKQFGSLWNKITPEEEKKKSGPVDCHEIWEWIVPENENDIGIQKLKEMLVICKDCHMTFHEGLAIKKASDFGLDEKAKKYLDTIRMMETGLSEMELKEQLAQEKEDWKNNLNIKEWIVDLSDLASQDYMKGRDPILRTDNKAGVTPDLIAGISFKTENGAFFTAQDANKLLDEKMKPTFKF